MLAQKPGIAFHVIGWLLFFTLVISFTFSEGDGHSFWQALSLPYLVFYGVYLLLFYGHAYLLFPKLYLKRRYAVYFAAVFILLVFVIRLRPFDGLMALNRGAQQPAQPSFGPRPPAFGPPPSSPPPRQQLQPQQPAAAHIDLVSIILFAGACLTGAVIPIVREWRSTQERAGRAEAEKALAELSFLKAQINPHFLFNTLNNIYSMAVTGHENTAASVLKLSNIMRYVTDEAPRDFVPLSSEVACVRDYIDLQKLRLNEKTAVRFSVEGNTEETVIAPLLLMTFVENVFKYGVSSHEISPLEMHIEAEEGRIAFFSRNRIFPATAPRERTGIGLSNARQRLEQLYPGRHRLQIEDEGAQFTVRLHLQTR